MTFIATCVFIILFFIRPFEIISSLRGLPILFVVGVIAGLFLIFDVIAGKVKLFKNGTDQMMLGFYLAIGLSHLSHMYFGGAVQSMQDFYPVFIGYFLIAHSINSEKKLKIFLALLTACVAFIAIEGILEAINGASYFGVQALEQGAGYNDEGARITIRRIKWVGPFSDPNDLAMVFVFVVPILLDYLLKRIVIIPLTLLGLILYGLYLTNSRGGFLSLLASIFAYIVLRYKSVKGLVIGLCLGGLLVSFGPSRMGNLSASEESAYGRLEAWNSGYQMFKSAPFFGVGKGMFTDSNPLTAHNSFVLTFAELGLLGVIVFVGIFYFPIRNGYKTIFKAKSDNTDKESLNLHNALLSSLIGLLTSMFFLSRSYVLLPYMTVALLMFFTTVVNKETGLHSYVNSSEDGMRQNMKNIFIIAVIGIVFVNVMIKVLL